MFALGVWKTRLTKVHWLLGGLETLAIGGVSCGLGFFFGKVIEALAGG